MITAQEVMREICALCDEPESVGEERFLFSLNRALSAVAEQLPTVSTLYIDKDTPAVNTREEATEYRLRDLAEDFLSVYSHPTTALGGVVSSGVEIYGDTLLCRKGVTLPLCIKYRRRPGRVSAENLTSPLDIRQDAEAAAVFLSASHLLWEEDPERSEYFMNMYRESVALATRATSDFSGGLEMPSTLPLQNSFLI